MPKGLQGQKAIATEAVRDLAIRLFLLLAIGFPLNFLFRWGLDSVFHTRPIFRDPVAFFVAFMIASFAVSAIRRRLNAQRS